MRAVIVEDEPLIGEALAEQVRRAGWEVAGIAADSQHARSLIATALPDLIILDVDLADGPTGPSLARACVRGAAEVVFVTAHEELVAEPEARAFPILRKPFRPEQLLAHLERVEQLKVA